MTTQGRHLATGASVRVIDGEDPETTAMLQALYSRSAESVDEHLAEVLERGSAKFMSSFYVGYNHKSIADCGSTTIFIEDVSLLVAKAIQASPLYSGQETSTRYLDMTARPIVDPQRSPGSAAVLARWMDFYKKALAAVPDEVRLRYPRRPEDKEDRYEAAVKARAFDVCRGFLPAGITTQLSWHTNLRQAHDHLSWLRHHPLSEVRVVAEGILGALAEKYPSSGFGTTAGAGVSGVTDGQAARDAWAAEAAAMHAYDEEAEEIEPGVRMWPNYAPAALMQYERLLSTRPRGAVLPHFLADVGQFGLTFDLDFGSFRDLQRHRNGVCRMPLLGALPAFESWYVGELPRALQGEAVALIESQREAIPSAVQNRTLAQYYRPLGQKVRCHVTYGLPALLYVLELRSQKTVHPTLRRRVLEAAKRVRAALPPYVAMHIETDPDDWTLRRGQQDIRRVEGS